MSDDLMAKAEQHRRHDHDRDTQLDRAARWLEAAAVDEDAVRRAFATELLDYMKAPQ